MKNTNALHKAALAFEKAIRQYLPFCTDGDTFDCKKKFDFGTVTAFCAGGEATLWVVFPDKTTTNFKLVKLDKSLLWIYHKRPKIIHTTFELFRSLSMWWDVIQWLESMKDREAAK